MAPKAWRASDLLTRPDAARAMAGRLTRRDWRRLRRLLKRPDLPRILVSMRFDQAQRLRFGPGRPVPWSIEDSLRALTSQRDRASLFGAIRLLQAAAPGAEPLGYAITPDREAVRIDQGLLLGFAGREVESVTLPAGSGAAAAPASTPGARWTGRPVLTQNAVGLLGPNGPMPYAWTQQVRNLPAQGKAQARQSFLAFINLVQRRQLALLYRAWSDALPVTAWDTGPARPHPVEQRLSALAGIAHGGLARQDSVPPAFKRAFAAALSRRVRSPGPLASMVALYLGVPVRVDEFSCRWLEIPPDQRTRIGQYCSRLGQKIVKRFDPVRGREVETELVGEEAVAGAWAWDGSTRFDLVVGPVDLATYLRLLPGQALHEEVRDLVALYIGPEWEWRLLPLLHAAEVPRAELGRPFASLGLTHWLGGRAGTAPAADLRLAVGPNLHPGARPGPGLGEAVEST